MTNADYARVHACKNANFLSFSKENTKPIGHIATQARLGFPAKLLLPLAPITATGMEGSQLGKVPARPAKKSDWIPISWKDGSDDFTLLHADKKGANCGLLLGKDGNDRRYIMLDGDLAAEAPDQIKISEIIRTLILEELTKYFDEPLWVRYTRPGRFAILVSVPATEHAGRKAIHRLTRRRGTLGGIEVLAEGQQTLLGGLHPKTGAEVWWERLDRPGERFRGAPVDEIPLVASRQRLDDILAAVSKYLGSLGIKIQVETAKSYALNANAPARPVVVRTDGGTEWAQNLMAAKCLACLTAAPVYPATRIASLTLGGLIGSGEFDDVHADIWLGKLRLCLGKNPYKSATESEATIAKGVADGKTNPLYPPETFEALEPPPESEVAVGSASK